MLTKIGLFFLRMLAATWRIEILGKFPPEHSVVAFRHGRMMPVWKIFAGRDASAIVSSSKDGQILTDLLRAWGYRVTRGSSSKNGKEALEAMTKNAKTGRVLITPDGPRGPAGKMKPGAFVAAMRAEVPLIFCNISIHKAKVFSKSWDNFELPLPFSKCRVTFSEPVTIEKDTSRDEVTQLIHTTEKEFNF